MGRMFHLLGVMICIKLDYKFDWLGLSYGLVCRIPVAARGWMG